MCPALHLPARYEPLADPIRLAIDQLSNNASALTSAGGPL